MTDNGGSYWRRGCGWLVRLFLVLFVVFIASFWTDLLSHREEYDRLFRSEHACAISRAYCSWGSYMLAQVPPSLIAVAAVVALSWRRLRHREAMLNSLAIAACLFLAWAAIQARSSGYIE